MYVDNETLLIWLDLQNGHQLPEIESGYRFMSKVYDFEAEFYKFEKQNLNHVLQ